MSLEQKTFHQLLLEFSKNPIKAKKGLSDRRLTALEKLIITSYFLLRDNDNKGVVESLGKMTAPGARYVEAHRELLLGLAYNNLTEYPLAISFLRKAAAYFKDERHEHFYFTSILNLFYVYANLMKSSEMEETIKLMNDCQLSGPTDLLRREGCLFIFHSVSGDKKSSEASIKKIETLFPAMTESDSIGHLLDLFTHYVRFDDFAACQKVLLRMKSFRKFHLTANYTFLKKLLENHLDDRPLYYYDAELEDQPILLYQFKVIQKLEEGQLDEAIFFWNKLRALDDKVYQEEFFFKGSKCLFSVCLTKHLKQKASQAVEAEAGANGKLEKLASIFKNTQGPILKEDIYEAVWGQKPQDKEDLIRLSRSIYRLKKQYQLDIKTRKGCYIVEKSGKKKAS